MLLSKPEGVRRFRRKALFPHFAAHGISAGTEESLSYWWAGNTKEGTGENEGYYTAGRFVEVEKIDGAWKVTDSGTGGYSTGVDGIRAVDWEIE